MANRGQPGVEPDPSRPVRFDSPTPLPAAGLGNALQVPTTWRRILLLAALLNAPLFFNGCEAKQTRFSAGALIPFAELSVTDQPAWLTCSLDSWSWRRLVGNFLVTTLGVALAIRYSRSIARLAQTPALVAILAILATLFNSWLVWPGLWAHAVFNPTLQVWALVLVPFGGLADASESTRHNALVLSARLYYLVCIAGAVGGFFGLRTFLRRYFFVPSGAWWQIQLRGLIIVVAVLGTLIGMAVRLLTLQQVGLQSYNHARFPVGTRCRDLSFRGGAGQRRANPL